MVDRKALYEFLFTQMCVATDTSESDWGSVLFENQEARWQHKGTGYSLTVKFG